MSKDYPYENPQTASATVTFQDFTTLGVGTTGIQLDQNGGVCALFGSIFPDSGRTSTSGAFIENLGANAKLTFYYDGPELASWGKITVGGRDFPVAQWADIGLAACYCFTTGGANISFKRPLEASWPVGARIVPRDSWSDSTGRHSQKIYCTPIMYDPNGTAGSIFTAGAYFEWRSSYSVATPGLANPSAAKQPGRLWGNSALDFSDATNYASGNTGLTFPQEGGIQWFYAAIRPDYDAGQGSGEQIGNVKVNALVKFYYDGPQVASTSTVSIASETWNYAYDKDISVSMFCVTNAGHWEIKEATDYNQVFQNPFRIVDREFHPSGIQRLHIKMDFEDPWGLVFAKVQGSVAAATVQTNPNKNFKGS